MTAGNMRTIRRQTTKLNRALTFPQRKLNLRQKRQVVNLISRRGELKFATKNTTGFVDVTSTGLLNGFVDITQNIGDEDVRIGDRLQWCGNLEIRLQVTSLPGVGADVYNTIRFIVFQWHPNSTPSTNNILIPGPLAGTFDVLSSYNHDQRQQYKIMVDKTINLVAGQNNEVRTFVRKVSVRRCAKYAQFTAASALGTNRFFYIILSDSFAAPHPQYALDSKAFYRDS